MIEPKYSGTSRRTLWILICVLGVLCVTLGISQKKAHEQSDAQADEVQNALALLRRLERTQNEQDRKLSHFASAPVAVRAPETRQREREADIRETDGPGTDARLLPSRELTSGELTEAEQAHVAVLEDKFEEATGGLPSEQTKSLDTRVRYGLRGLGRLHSIACRETICRVETLHQDLQSYEAYVTKAYLSTDQTAPEANGPWQGAAYIAPVERSDRGIVAVAYLARDNGALPSAP
jgi:hypothetical protein